jgi:UDP-N-acetylmuramyl tripeptide synthase
LTGGGVVLNGVDSLRVTLAGAETPPLTLQVGVPGLYNVYNVVAAATTARVLGVTDATIGRALANFRAAFGRIERATLRGRTLVLALVKNPVGFNEVLRMLTMATGGLTVPTLIAINDLDADGRDVSWLWDVDFELLADGDAPLSTTGLRGADMANRLKYAGVESTRIVSLGSEMRQALDAFVAGVPAGETAYILPTYTAMLELRRILADLGAVETFWKQ